MCTVGCSSGRGVEAVGDGLSGIKVCYVSVAGFAGIWRTLKQADSARSAGGHPVFSGYDARIPAHIGDSGFEVHAVPGLRFRTSHHPIRPLRIAANILVNNPYNRWLTSAPHQDLVADIVRSRPDVVQAVDLPSLDVAARAARRCGAALVFDSAEYWSGFVNNPDMNLDASYVDRLMGDERRHIGTCSLVFTTSDEMAERLVEDYGIARPVTIYNAPPVRIDTPCPSSQPLKLVFHGGLSKDRNIDGLIRAVKILDGKVTLDVHGFDRTEDADTLRALVAQLGLTDSVRLHGEFHYSEVVELLSAYDVGVLTAKMVEENFMYTLPNKVFDCMCAGLAVAMSDSPPMRALVEREGFGIVLDPDSPESIATALECLALDRGRVDEMKRRAVEASQRYWWPRQGQQVTRALEEMLGRK